MKLFSAFERVAKEHANLPALVYDNQVMRYDEVLAVVCSLAQRLTAPQKSALVIAGPKRLHSVLWQLSANFAGQVFIPCDGSIPPQRFRDIVARTKPRWIAAPGNLDYTAQGYLPIHVAGEEWLWCRDDSTEYCHDVSHIIFSSGSTGAPKAILLPDTPVIDVVQSQAKLMGLTPASRFAWLLSPAFDASLSDVYATLLSGAALHICGFSLTSVKVLRRYFQEQAITHTDLSPSVLPLLAPQDLPSLRTVVFGGEIAKEVVIKSWLSAGVHLLNAYGPTEATICSSMRVVDNSWLATNIGKPLPGVSYALREGSRLVCPAPGDRGELYITGEHLALGYDNSGLTANRFLELDGTRCYKTGDLIEVDREGEFHFLGRVDRQFKQHGVLICPEEIEAAALSAGCHEALLKVERDKLVLHFAGPVTDVAVRSALKSVLPATLLPHRYVAYATLPKSASGKIQL